MDVVVEEELGARVEVKNDVKVELRGSPWLTGVTARLVMLK